MNPDPLKLGRHYAPWESPYSPKKRKLIDPKERERRNKRKKMAEASRKKNRAR